VRTLDASKLVDLAAPCELAGDILELRDRLSLRHEGRANDGPSSAPGDVGPAFDYTAGRVAVCARTAVTLK
jgi:hypothetical protein